MPSTSQCIQGLGLFFLSFMCVIGIIEGSVSAAVIAKFNNGDNMPNNSYRDRLRFLCFTGWWTVALCFLYVLSMFVRFMGVFSSIASHWVFCFITWVFWLSGAASLTDTLGGGKRCGRSTLPHCSYIICCEAFAWIGWIVSCFWFLYMWLVVGRAFRQGDTVSEPLQDA